MFRIITMIIDLDSIHHDFSLKEKGASPCETSFEDDAVNPKH